MLKAVYTIAVLLFTANMLAGVAIKRRADKTADAATMYRAFVRIIRSDLFITIPALLIILVTGFYVNDGKYIQSLSLRWLVVLLIAYSSLVFVFIVHPIRRALQRIACEGVRGGNFDAPVYRQYSKFWVFWGVIELMPLMGLLLYSLVA